MKIVIIGGSGLIGSKVVNKLRDQGNEAVPAALVPDSNAIIGGTRYDDWLTRQLAAAGT
jgi:uncharacterized protein YbjT (DUF2867 family)